MATIETQTKISLISKALVLLGEKPCNTLSDDRYGVTVGANMFELLYEAELQNNGQGWHFCRAKKNLSRLFEEPLNEYKYAYQLPSDMLLPVGTYPKIEYEIYGDRVYTHASAVGFEYKFKPDISRLPAYFSLLMVYCLARNMAKPVTESDATAGKWEREYIGQHAKAQFADAQGRPNKPIRNSPFTRGRFTSQ